MFETFRRQKDPNESIDYACLFRLAPTDSVASATAETVDAQSQTVVSGDLLIAPARFALQPNGAWAAQARLTGGGVSSEYFIRWTVFTINGQSMQTTTRLVVRHG